MSRVRSIRAAADAQIAADRAEVFRFLTDPDLVPRWVKGLVESRPEGDGGIRVGARSVEVTRSGGRTVTMAAEIVELVPDAVVAIRLETPGGVCVSRFELAQIGSGCRVRHRMTDELALPRLIPRRLVETMLAARLRQDLGRLSRLVESERRN